MTTKTILLITFVWVLLLILGFCWVPWVEGYFEFYPVNVSARPFIASGYYPYDGGKYEASLIEAFKKADGSVTSIR